MQQIKIDWIWLPCKSIGPFVFNDDIKNYIAPYKLILDTETYSDAESVAFNIEGYESTLHIENGVIESINCHDSLIYKKVDLIGKSFNFVEKLIDEKHNKMGEEIYMSDGPQVTIEYDNLGLQLWKNQDDIIVSAFCNGLID